MRVFRQRYTSGDGQTRESGLWYVSVREYRARQTFKPEGAARPPRPREWRIPAFSDRRVTEQFGERLQRLVDCRAGGETPDRELTAWLEKLPDVIRQRIERIGLLDARRVAAAKPLAAHLEDFDAALHAKGGTGDHARKTAARARAVLEGCGFVRWSDIAPARVEVFLAGERRSRGEGKPGVSIQTSNYYLGAFKQFCKWMVTERRASESPVAHLKKLNAATDRRRKRRALSVEECRKLIAAARNGVPVAGMPGPDRAMLYRLALETGLRWNELRTLARGCFALDAVPQSVTVKAGYSKHRREDVIPLRPETAEAMRAYLGNRLPDTPAFPMPASDYGAEMIARDLAAAGLAVEDDAGNVADFHALRHTFITNLVNGGVLPKTAQALARHSSITLTMDRYTHLTVASQTAALDALPNLSPPEATAARATGTDDASVLPPYLPPNMRQEGFSGDALTQTATRATEGANVEKAAPALGKPRPATDSRRWALLDSNQRPRDYESPALTN